MRPPWKYRSAVEIVMEEELVALRAELAAAREREEQFRFILLHHPRPEPDPESESLQGYLGRVRSWWDNFVKPALAEPPFPTVSTASGTVQMNIDPAWLTRAAEAEGNGCFSVGGLAVDLGMYRKPEDAKEEDGG